MRTKEMFCIICMFSERYDPNSWKRVSLGNSLVITKAIQRLRYYETSCFNKETREYYKGIFGFFDQQYQLDFFNNYYLFLIFILRIFTTNILQHLLKLLRSSSDCFSFIVAIILDFFSQCFININKWVNLELFRGWWANNQTSCNEKTIAFRSC